MATLARISHTGERLAFDLRRSTMYIREWLNRITKRQRAAALDHATHVGGVVWRQGGYALSGSWLDRACVSEPSVGEGKLIVIGAG